MIKKILTILLVLQLISNTFAAPMLNNDGTAFITKAEFDVLKNSFQTQIDKYNTSIDSALDTAIASYLAGIKTEKVTTLDNKYRAINPTWMRNKRFDGSKLGTKYTSYISFTELIIGGTGKHGIYLFEGTGNSWYVVKELINNSTDQEYLYRVSKKQISDFADQWSLNDLIKADYSITIIGGASGGRGGNFEGNNRLGFPTETLFDKGTNEYFGTWYATLPIEIWDVNTSTVSKQTFIGNINGSGDGGEEIAISAVASDTVELDNTLFYLSGGEIVNDIMYCLNTADVSKLGDAFATTVSSHGSSRHFRVNDASTGMVENINWQFRDYGGYSSAYSPGISAEVYRHKIETINSVDLLNEPITQNTRIRSYFYSGCPLFTATADGKVKFTIKFINTANTRTKWALKDSQFTNAPNPGNCGSIANCSETTFLANNDETITVSFDVVKNKTYWIKVEPESGYTTIEFDGDIVQSTEE